MTTYTFECPTCHRQEPVNTNHPLFKDGTWKVGSNHKLFCWTCKKNRPHILKETK